MIKILEIDQKNNQDKYELDKLNIIWYNISVANKHCTLKGKG